MKSNDELYEFIDKLKEELVRLGEFSAAERLSNALYISSVGTEVFLALRKELTQLIDSNIGLSPEFLDKTKESIRAIGMALSC